jgi:FAD-dependent oxidoreductase domain-containing protein 1
VAATSTIAIVGGGIVGSSTAYYLAMTDRAADVVVIEPDPSYEFAATPRATGTIRRTFSLPEKVTMSTYANIVYRNFSDYVDVDGQPAGNADFNPGGYLYLVAGRAGIGQIERVKQEMDAAGVRTEILDSDAVSAKFPEIQINDIDMGLFSPDDGWIDPFGALQGFKGKARAMGVTYKKDRVVGINIDGRKARSVVLESGDVLEAACVVNCANCWAPEVSNMVGMTIPVAPLRRMSYYFDTQKTLSALPLVRDMNGVSVRPEGKGYLTGVTDYTSNYGFNWNLDYTWFENTVWPKLANRIPSFEAVKLKSCWSGHYDMSLFDRCPFIGPWTGHLDNFYIAAGFSGHGLQHAPATARGLSELIMTGRYQTLDLSRLSFDRVGKNAPLVDDGPVS